jgi:hypothetical protein
MQKSKYIRIPPWINSWTLNTIKLPKHWVLTVNIKVSHKNAILEIWRSYTQYNCQLDVNSYGQICGVVLYVWTLDIEHHQITQALSSERSIFKVSLLALNDGLLAACVGCSSSFARYTQLVICAVARELQTCIQGSLSLNFVVNVLIYTSYQKKR